MHIKPIHIVHTIVAVVIAMIVSAVPVASAAPSCFGTGTTIQCQAPGNAEIHTAPPVRDPGPFVLYGPFFAYDRGR